MGNFGSGGEWKLAVYVTTAKGAQHVVVPHSGDPTVVQRGGNWYSKSGYNSNNPFVEFDLPGVNEETYYCFEKGKEYQIWHGEDMIGSAEHDNHGTAYTDILIKS